MHHFKALSQLLSPALSPRPASHRYPYIIGIIRFLLFSIATAPLCSRYGIQFVDAFVNAIVFARASPRNLAQLSFSFSCSHSSPSWSRQPTQPTIMTIYAPRRNCDICQLICSQVTQPATGSANVGPVIAVISGTGPQEHIEVISV